MIFNEHILALLCSLCLAFATPLPAYVVNFKCYHECQREACKSVCQDPDRSSTDEDCRSCLIAYDQVCLEQCRVGVK